MMLDQNKQLLFLFLFLASDIMGFSGLSVAFIWEINDGWMDVTQKLDDTTVTFWW